MTSLAFFDGVWEIPRLDRLWVMQQMLNPQPINYNSTGYINTKAQ